VLFLARFPFVVPLTPVIYVTSRLTFHQSNCASAIKRKLFYYRHVSIFVFFHVFLCSLLLPCMLESSALRVGEKMLHNTCNYQIERHATCAKAAHKVSCSSESHTASRFFPIPVKQYLFLFVFEQQQCGKYLSQHVNFENK